MNLLSENVIFFMRLSWQVVELLVTKLMIVPKYVAVACKPKRSRAQARLLNILSYQS